MRAATASLHGGVWSGDARDTFAEYWTKTLRREFEDEQLARYSAVAAQLEQTAQKIEDYNHLAQALEFALATCACVSVLTAGIGTAFGAGGVVVAAAEASAAYGALQVFLSLLATTFVTFAQWWAASLAFGLASNAIAITLTAPDHNPFNPDHWSIGGLAQAINGATAAGVVGIAGGMLAPAQLLAARHPVGWSAGVGGVSAAVPGAYNLLVVEDQDLSDAWWRIGLSTVAWSGWSAGVSKLFGSKPQPDLVRASLSDRGDWTRTSGRIFVQRPPKGYHANQARLLVPTPFSAAERQRSMLRSVRLGVLPSTAMRLLVPYSDGQGVGSQLLQPLIDELLSPPEEGEEGETGSAAFPPLKLPPPPRPVRPVVHRRYTVRLNDSLWTIAGARLGDPTRWPEIATANPQIRDPRRIHPGDVIRLPSVGLRAAVD